MLNFIPFTSIIKIMKNKRRSYDQESLKLKRNEGEHIIKLIHQKGNPYQSYYYLN